MPHILELLLLLLTAIPISVASSSFTLLFQNSLNWTQNAVSHPGLLLSSTPLTQTSARDACNSLSETLVDLSSANTTTSLKSAYESLLNFQIHIDALREDQLLWVAQPTSIPKSQCSAISPASLKLTQVSCTTKLPALCTNSAPYSDTVAIDTSPRWQSSVQVHGRTFTGYRDYASFRFLGIPYANPAQRWEYSSVYSGSARSFNATKSGPHCMQPWDTNVSEDCLFLNVFTPYLPASTGTPGLKPVMLWIHGGGFVSGYGSDPTFDGGALASRGDAVVVTINYRVGTLGFLSLNDGVIGGNYGLQDQITAMQWVKANIAAFGGDPNHITLFGQSAGAGSIRALLGSPKADGLFQGAILQSNLAGSTKVAATAQNIIALTNCASTDPTAVRTCLKAVPAATFVSLSSTADYVVVDGTYITSSQLPLDGKTAGVSKVPTIWGWMADDGSPFIGYPEAGLTAAEALIALGVVNASMANTIVQSGLFPTPNTGNVTLDAYNVSARVTTDIEFRCLDQATISTAVKNNVFPVVYAFELNRSYQIPNWSPNSPVCDAPVTSAYPNGDADLPYFKCHSGDLFYVFGTLGQFNEPLRDAEDLAFNQYIVDIWSSFGRTFNPNPDLAWLKARGYTNTLEQIAISGKWDSVAEAGNTPLRILDGKDTASRAWKELDQCDVLGYPLNYYA